MLETRIYLTNQLGSLLKDYRKSQNISQKELAERGLEPRRQDSLCDLG